MIGEKFNKWTVVCEVRKPKQLARQWQCICDCGTMQVMNSWVLKTNKSTQCSKCAHTKHNMSSSQTFKIWGGILSRCNNPKVKIYPRYGGRGISVCERWEKFENFLADMGERPADLQLDRIDNDGNYEPSNCRWVTSKQNCNNRNIKDDMPGKRFGKWVVGERIYKENQTHWYYNCACDCGTKKVISGGQLRRGNSTQCKSCKDKTHGSVHKGWSERKKQNESRNKDTLEQIRGS